jgi:type I restriction enzyme S subunit
MSGWKEVFLEDVADELAVGYVGPMASEYVDDGIPFLRSLNVEPLRIKKHDLKFISPEFHSRISKSRLSPGDVVIVRTGKPGACALIPEWLADANCSDLVIVRCGEQIDNQFLVYYVNTIAGAHISAHLVGAVQQHFNVGSARSLKIALPSLPEQKAIATVLSSLDDKIDLLHRQNATLEAMAETLFRQWFVVEAREDWVDGCMGDVAYLFNGKARPSDMSEGGIPVFGGNGIMGYSSKSNYDGITIIIGRVGAYCGSIFIEHNPVWVSDNALVAKPVNPKYSSYLFYLLKYLDLNEMAEGSSHPLLTQTLIKSIQIKLAPTKLIEKFVFQADSWLLRIKRNNTQIRTLEKLRDTLLPKLMSGEVRVKELL